MAKQQKSPAPAKAPKMARGNDEGGRYVDRDLAGMKPEKAQEALQPTDAEPVRMHAKMAGAC